MRRLTGRLVGSALWLGLVCGQAWATEEDRVLDRIEKRHKELKSVIVDFDQEVNSGVFATVDKSSGRMFFAAGDRFRIETDQQTVVCDSVVLWVYSPENKQVKIDSVSKVTDLVKPSDYIFSFKEDYQADLLPERNCSFGECYQVVLTAARDDRFVKEMKLYIDSQTLLTRRAEYRDINGNLVTIRFRNYKLDKPIPAGTFHFKTPKGVEEIRLP